MVSGAVLFPVAVALFWLWQVVAWIAARGRWARVYAGDPAPLRQRPRFMEGITLPLAWALLDGAHLLRAVGALFLVALPVLGSVVLGIAALSFVVFPLMPSVGPLGGAVAGIVVMVGIMVPFIMAQGHLRQDGAAARNLVARGR